jgi:hypothetical protein
LDLFEAYPQLVDHDLQALGERSLRLISVSGFVYDDDSLYFELGQPRHWGRMADGGVSIGVGVPKVQPDGTHPPHQALLRYLRKSWRSQVNLFPTGYSYLLDEAGAVHMMGDVDADLPYFFIFTSPRLGGGEVPDALVQAVYLLPVRRIRAAAASEGLLRIDRHALQAFIEPESWSMRELIDQPWAEILTTTVYPEDASIRPVLALRGLRALMDAGALPGLPTAARLTRL